MFKKIHYILFLLITVFSSAQVTLRTETDALEYKITDKVKLTVALEVIGKEMETPLRLPDFSQFKILNDASEQNTFLDPQKNNINQIFYQVLLQPKRTGKIKIGSVLVTVNGKIYKTEPFEIYVTEGDAAKTENVDVNNDIYLNVEVEDEVLYENQPTVAVLRAFSKNYDNFRKVQNINIPKAQFANIHNVSYKKQDIEPVSNGSNYSSQIIATFIIFPKKAGKVEIPAISAVVNNAIDKSKIVSNKLKLNVKKLPANAPIDFKNAVGNFNVEITNAAKELIELGKPTQILVKISGEGNLKDFQIPKIMENTNFSVYKPRILEKLQSGKNGFSGEIVANYIIIPKIAGTLPIKLESFSFFNPKENKYINLGEKELSISVLTPEQILSSKTPLEVVNEYTSNIVQQVQLPTLEKHEYKLPEPRKRISWLFVMSNIGLAVLASALLFSIYNRRKINKSAKKNTEQKPVTTVAETEALLKNKLDVNIDDELHYLKTQIENKDIEGFFSSYQELYNNTENTIKSKYNKELKDYLIENKGEKFFEEFRHLKQLIEIEKYAPVHEESQIDGLYHRIVNLFSEIMK